ncbi:MAG: DUF86 domain-containing protein [Fimbriimonadaceae bacterium]|nr:DUF86 domain-containing protein [Fimbriimonadaceae bacterium]QYK57415.1 MAG: DUF86 domain-containing protein [Fimbriimonadaceae bacterium]
MRDPKERLRDILEAVAAIQRQRPQTKEEFEQNELVQGWFVRHLQIIGEAARAVPQEVRALAPDVEWAKVVGMRNVLVHGYFDVDVDIVWEAATRDVVALGQSIGNLLRQLESGHADE